MLPNHQYPIPQREPLLRIIRNRGIHRSMSDRNARLQYGRTASVRAADIPVRSAHGFGETRVQNSSKTLVSKKAVALTTLPSFISRYQV